MVETHEERYDRSLYRLRRALILNLEADANPPSEEEIEEFCRLCDSKEDEQRMCDQGRYVGRNWCGDSFINGVRVYTTKDKIRVSGEETEYLRSDISGLTNAIEKVNQEQR